MKYRLKLSGLDEADEEQLFDSQDEAIEYARKWFLDGYDNDTVDDSGRAEAREEAERIEQDLRDGRQFNCSMFYEQITLEVIP